MVGFLYFYRAEKETERDRVLQELYHSVDKITVVCCTFRTAPILIESLSCLSSQFPLIQ